MASLPDENLIELLLHLKVSTHLTPPISHRTLNVERRAVSIENHLGAGEDDPELSTSSFIRTHGFNGQDQCGKHGGLPGITLPLVLLAWAHTTFTRKPFRHSVHLKPPYPSSRHQYQPQHQQSPPGLHMLLNSNNSSNTQDTLFSFPAHPHTQITYPRDTLLNIIQRNLLWHRGLKCRLLWYYPHTCRTCPKIKRYNAPIHR